MSDEDLYNRIILKTYEHGDKDHYLPFAELSDEDKKALRAINSVIQDIFDDFRRSYPID